MSRLSWLMAALAVLAGSGCESVSGAASAVRERMAAREIGRTREYAAPPRAVYDAVRAAAGQMSYRMVRGGAAQGEYEGVGNVHLGDRQGSSRQLALRVKLRGVRDGAATELTAWFTEIIEADSSNRAGLATSAPLRDTPQYEVLFQRVAQVLGPGSAPEEKSR